jgi:hypothetical protein
VFACATPGRDDLQVSLTYPDGSTAVLTYATTGAPGFPKESIDLLADGAVLHVDDFARAAVHGRNRWSSSRLGLPRGRDKGQRAQLDAFLAALRSGDAMPIGLDSLVATTRATLAVDTSLSTGAPVRLDQPVRAVRPEPVGSLP